MQLSKEQEDRVIAGIIAELSERAWAKLEGQIEEIVAFSAPRAAGMLDLSVSQLNRTAPEVIDFGPRDGRYSVALMRRMVAARTVKKKKP